MADDPAGIRNWQRLDAHTTTSGQPTEAQLAALAATGVRHVVNLALHTHPLALADEAASVRALSMDYTHIPVAFDAPAEADFAAFRSALAQAARPVHVHCIANYRVSAFFYRYNRDVLGMADAQARAGMDRIWQPDAVWQDFIALKPAGARMDADTLRPFAGYLLPEATIPELPNHYRGKVRDNYDLPDGRRVIIATDRLSAFDRILCTVPFKGEVLTQTARHCFEHTADICPNHVLDYPDPNVVVGRRLDILPVEVVVRGFLAGTTGTSVLTLYKAGHRSLYGVTLPDGMRDNQMLPHPILTPTSKAADGGHDAPLTPADIVDQGLLTAAQWRLLGDTALALFARGQAMAAACGLILADTKYEFGTTPDGTVVLADEIHTPDSSRYWKAASYGARFEAGERPDSFDKDFVRSWVTARCDPYRDDIPGIPEDLILGTAALYIEAFETITGQRFQLPDHPGPVLDRVRANLAPLF